MAEDRLERGVVEVIFQYLDEPLLWPVLFALLGHLVIVIAPLGVYAYRDHSPLALLGLLLLVAGSVAGAVFEHRHRGRPGALTLGLSTTWLVSAGVAWLGVTTSFI